MHEVIIIAAVGSNGVIGKDNDLPWSVPDEYHHYLERIRDTTVIMGRKSFEIFGEDLTSKTNLVVSRSMTGKLVFPDLTKALQYARSLPENIFVAGGAGIYREAMRLADALYISFIKGSYEGDTFFPEINEEQWRIDSSVEHPEFTFVVYRKR